MFERNEKTYAEAFKYLRNEGKNAVALSVNNPEGWEEIGMPEGLDVETETRQDSNGEVIGYYIFFMRRLFIIRVGSLEYGEVKRAIIQRRYSMDDQMAIQLNRERGEEYEREYERMQEWRDFAAAVAREAAQGVVEDGLRLVGGEPGASGGE